MQFTAYNNLFDVVKDADKLFPSVAGCVMEALSEIKALCPSAFTIKDLNEELALMAMLCSLPCDQYAEFVNSLMHTPSLTLATVQALFQTEQAEAQFVASAPCTSPKALAAVADTEKPICLFCGIANHTQERCFKFLNTQKCYEIGFVGLVSFS
jgi:sialic acid synthase SpsE